MKISPESSPYGIVSHADHTFTIFVPRGEYTPINPDGSFTHTSEQSVHASIVSSNLPVSMERGPLIGWGAKSAAIRIKDSEQNSYAVVFKPIHDRHTYPLEDDPQMTDDCKPIILTYLKQHIHTSHYVLSDGIAGKPALLKIGKEIHGVPLSEHHPLLLLSDKAAISNTIQLYTDVLKLAKEKGILVDLWGNISPGVFRKLLNQVYAFSMRNVIIEYPSMSLPIVDVSPIPEYTKYSVMSSKHKAVFYMKYVSLFAANMVLKSASKLLTLRDKLFERAEIPDPTQESFVQGFQETMRIVKNSGIDYRVVGSFALAGLMKHKDIDMPMSAHRENGTKRDIDIVCIASDEKITQLRQEIEAMKKNNPDYPDVSLLSVPHTSPIALWGLVKLPADSVTADGRIQKTHGDSVLTFTKRDTEPYTVHYWDESFVTYSPELTAAHYLLRTGIILPEDAEKVRQLCKAYNCSIPVECIDFVRTMRKNNVFQYNIFVIRSVIDFWTGGHATHVLHGLRNALHKYTHHTSHLA